MPCETIVEWASPRSAAMHVLQQFGRSVSFRTDSSLLSFALQREPNSRVDPRLEEVAKELDIAVLTNCLVGAERRLLSAAREAGWMSCDVLPKTNGSVSEGGVTRAGQLLCSSLH